MDKKIIGERLRILRGDKRREVVAADNDISVSALSNYENGERIPRDQIKVSLANYYHTTVESIFYAR